MGFAAVQSLGAVPIPLYQDAVAQEMAFVMEDADIHFAFAEDQEQVHCKRFQYKRLQL